MFQNKINIITVLTLSIIVINMTVVIFTINCWGNTEKLRFAGISETPPMAFEEEGIIKGLFPTLFFEIAKRAGFEATVELLPFKRLDKYLQTGIVDGTISIYHKQERESYLMYAKYPSLISYTRIFVRKGEDFPFSSVNDLSRKTVGTIAGWIINNPALDNAIKVGRITVDEATSYEQNIKKLIAKRFDCLIAGEQITWYHANKLGIAQEITLLDKPISESITYIAISKKSQNIPNYELFMENLNQALYSIISDGTYKAIQQQYGVRTLK